MVGAVSHVKSVTIADGTNTDIVRPSDWDSSHNAYLTISGNTNNASTWSGTNLVMQYDGLVTGKVTGNTLIVSGPPPVYLSLFAPFSYSNLSLIVVISNSTSHAVRFMLPLNVSASYFRIVGSFVATSQNSASSTNTTLTAQLGSTLNFGLFSWGTGASSQSLTQVYSTSLSYQSSWTFGANSTGSQWSIGQSISYFGASGVSSSVTFSAATSSSNFIFDSTQFTNFTNSRLIEFPFATSLSAGDYVALFGASSSSAGNIGLTRMNIQTAGFYGGTANQVRASYLGTGASALYVPGFGNLTSTNATVPSGFDASQVGSVANGPYLYFEMIRS